MAGGFEVEADAEALAPISEAASGNEEVFTGRPARGREAATSSISTELLWMLGAAFTFGFANAISHGTWQPIAFVVLFVLLGALTWRFFVPLSRQAYLTDARRAAVVAVALVGMQPVLGLADPKVVRDVGGSIALLRCIQVALLCLVSTYLPFLARSESEALRRLRFASFAVLVFVLGLVVFWFDPHPQIDVWSLQMRGAEIFTRGQNPYTHAAVPDTDPENTFTVPYVYPPASIYAGAMGLLVGGDVRYALLGAVLATGIAIRFVARRHGRAAVPSILEDAPALIFWLTPIMPLVLELSWVDPIQSMMVSLGLAAFCANKRNLAAVFFGVAASSKQSMFWLLPMAAMMLGFRRKQWVVMGLAAVAPVLPFVIWDFRALKFSTFDFMSQLPPRRDALCFTNAMYQWFRLPFPTASAFVLAAGVVAIAIARRRGKSPFAFAQAVVLTYFVFFFFNRWAFTNYYFLLTGLSALAAAAALRQRASMSASPLLAPKNQW